MLADPAFRLVWYVGGVAEFSRRMELLVLSWLILQITDSYFQLGLVLFFNNAGRPVSFPSSTGYIADRFSRKKVLLTGQVDQRPHRRRTALGHGRRFRNYRVLAYIHRRFHSGNHQDHRRPLPAHRHHRHSRHFRGWSTPCRWTFSPTTPARCWVRLRLESCWIPPGSPARISS